MVKSPKLSRGLLDFAKIWYISTLRPQRLVRRKLAELAISTASLIGTF